MRAKVLVATTLCLVVSIFALTGVSLAKSSPISHSRVEAELEPCGGDPCVPGSPPEDEAEGKARRDTKKRNGVVERDEFKAKVKIPVPSPGLGIADAAAAEAADIRLILNDGTSDYAECFLKFTEVETELEDGVTETEAVYKVMVRSRLKKGVQVLQEVQGTCDTDLTTSGIQAGVPDVQEDDIATAVINGVVATPFLEGTFEDD